MYKSRHVIGALFLGSLLAACSGAENAVEPGADVEANQASDQALPEGARAAAESVGDESAAQEFQVGETIELRAGAVRLGEGVELLANVEAANGNEVQFIARGDDWTIFESGPVGNLPIATDLVETVSDPLVAFSLVAPDAKPPARLLEFVDDMPQRMQLSEAAAEQRREEVRKFEELKAEHAPAADGLNAGGYCSYTWFTSNICTGTNFKTRWNTYPENTQFKDGLTYSWNYSNSHASEGAGFVCGDSGTVTLQYWTAAWGTFANRDINQGYWGTNGKWYSQSCYQSCSGWSCHTVCNPSYQNANIEVDNVGGSDRFHFCGWYNPDGD